MRILLRKFGGIGSSFPILIVLAALCLASIFIIISATFTNDALKDAYSSQVKYLILGAMVYLVLGLTPYQSLLRVSPILYGISILLLIAVFVHPLGRKVFGAYSCCAWDRSASSRPNSPSSPSSLGWRGC